MLTILVACFGLAGFSFALIFRENIGMITKDYVYQGPILKSRTTEGFLACSHFCLSFPECFSFNYDSSAVSRGLCELHSLPRDTIGGKRQELELAFKPGFVFVRTYKEIPRSCADHVINGYYSSGLYDIYDSSGNTFTVYCDISSEKDSVWTLIMSTSLGKAKPVSELSRAGLMADAPREEDNPNWLDYRLSHGRMLSIESQSTLWRITCSLDRYGVDYRDYARAKIANFDPLTFSGNGKGGECKNLEFINVRGRECRDCSSAWWQETIMMLHHDSSVNYCDFGKTRGGVENEDNFGYYKVTNPKFRCTADNDSTTNYWFGQNI